MNIFSIGDLVVTEADEDSLSPCVIVGFEDGDAVVEHDGELYTFAVEDLILVADGGRNQ